MWVVQLLEKVRAPHHQHGSRAQHSIKDARKQERRLKRIYIHHPANQWPSTDVEHSLRQTLN